MTAGKTFQILLFILIYPNLLLYCDSVLSPSVLKGGLVYSEESSLGPVYLNRDHVNFIRTIDTSALQQSAQAIRDYTTLYHTFCRQIGKHSTPFDKELSIDTTTKPPTNKTFDIVFSPVKYQMKEGQQVCRNMGARLPEIRDRETYNDIRFAAMKKRVTKIRAGVYYDTSTLAYRYYSDDKPANEKDGKSVFPFISYGGEWEGGKYLAAWEDDPTLKRSDMAPKHFLIYNEPHDSFAIRLSDSADKRHLDYIMCEKPIDNTVQTLTKENNILLQLAHHACKRDEKALVSSTRYILAEIEAITNLNVTLQDSKPKMSDYFPNIGEDVEETKQDQNREVRRDKRSTQEDYRRYNKGEISIWEVIRNDILRLLRIPEHLITTTPSTTSTTTTPTTTTTTSSTTTTTPATTSTTTTPSPTIVRSCSNTTIAKRRKRHTKSNTEVTKDIQTLNESFKILIKLMSTPNFTTEKPHYNITSSYKSTEESTTMESVKSDFDKQSLPTEPPITTTIPLYLVELYHLWHIQRTAQVHNYPFDVWLYKKITLRTAARNLPSRFKRRQPLPEQKEPWNYITHILQNTSNIQEETQFRAEIYATDRMYKITINKRILEAIDEYIDQMLLEDNNNNNNTLVDVFSKVQQNINQMTSTASNISHRTRRTPSPNIAFTGMGITNMADSIITNDAPLSWLGEALGYLLGFPTKSSSEFKQIAKNARSVQALNINQDALAQTVNLLSKRLTVFGSYILQTLKAAATLTMEQDLKIIIRHMQVILQLTLTKYANVLMAAQLGKTSPYAMSRYELSTYGAQLKTEKGIQIVNRVEDTKSSVALLNNQIHLLIQAPIIDEQKLFNFYHIKSLPTFMENKTFQPILDAEYVAISRSGAKYVETTATEFTRCVLQPDICTVSHPITPINEQSLCVIRTYQSQKLTCPLQETKKTPKPLIYITANKAIYAVPQESHLYVKCSDHTETHTYTDETVTINGTGEVTFKPSCTVTLPGGATFDTPAAVHEQQITGSGLFEILRRESIPTNIVINRLADNFPTLPTIVLEEIDHYQDIWQQTLEPDTLKPFAIRISALLLVILILTGLIYCCCPQQTKDCCKLICWVTRKGKRKTRKASYDLNTARQQDILLRKLSTQIDELAQPDRPARPEFKRWTSAGQLFNTFGRPVTPAPRVKNVPMEMDEIDNPIPPPIGSPHISYKLKDIEQAINNSPAPKRVHFNKESTENN